MFFCIYTAPLLSNTANVSEQSNNPGTTHQELNLKLMQMDSVGFEDACKNLPLLDIRHKVALPDFQIAIGEYKHEKGALISNRSTGRLQWMAPETFDHFLLENTSLLTNLLKDSEFLLHWIDGNFPEAWKPAFLKNPSSFIFRLGSPKKNYTLAAIIGEDQFYPDLTQQDHLISFLHLPLLQFTEHKTLHRLYFWHLTDPSAIEILESHLEEYTAQEDIILEIRKALSMWPGKALPLSDAELNPSSYLTTIEKILNTKELAYDFENIAPEFHQALSKNIQIFCASNGVHSPKDLNQATPDFISALADRFLMAKTTAFFRDWREMDFLKTWLTHHQTDLESQGRYSKIKIYGCSTGQEPLSLAIHFHQNNFHNFKILATDIDPLVIDEAKTFTYPASQFENIGTEHKQLLTETYFQRLPSNFFTLKYPQFFERRIAYQTQDITKPLIYPDTLAPPYDIIMIKNVLLYIEPQVVQQTIDDIANMVADFGLLWIKDKFHSVQKYQHTVLKNFLLLSPYVAIKKPEHFEDQPEEILNILGPELTDQFMISLIQNLSHSVKPQQIKSLLISYASFQNSIASLILEWLICIHHKDYVGGYQFFKQIILADPNYFHVLADLSGKDFDKVLKHHFPLSKFQGIFKRILNADVSVDALELELKKASLNEASPECLVMICESLSYKDLGILSSNFKRSGLFLELALRLIHEHPQKNSLFLIQEWISLVGISAKLFPQVFKFHVSTISEKVEYLKSRNMLNQMSRISKIELALILQKKVEIHEHKGSRWSQTVLELLEMSDSDLMNLHEKTLSDYYFVKALAYIEEVKLSSSTVSQEQYRKEALRHLNEVVRLNTVYSHFAQKWIHLLDNHEV